VTRATVIKIIAGLLVIIGSGFYLIPRAELILQPESPIDGGDRGLVVVATEGGNPELSLTTRQEFAADGDVSLIFFFTAPNITFGADGNVKPVEVRVAFVGSAFTPGSIRCGETAPWSIGWNDVADGTRNAIEVDAASKRNSAINYDNAGTEVISRLQKATILEYKVRMWPLTDGSTRHDRQQDDKGNLFAEKCTFSSESAWRLEQGKAFDDSSKRTLLPFQLNWTSIGQSTDFQRTLRSSIVIERGEGSTLTEAYPQANVYDDTWFYENEVDWNMKLGEVGNLGYTDQPVYLFSARSANDRQAVIMLWSGVLLGLVATIIARTASLIIDAVVKETTPT
jgi:hypothetical protein